MVVTLQSFWVHTSGHQHSLDFLTVFLCHMFWDLLQTGFAPHLRPDCSFLNSSIADMQYYIGFKCVHSDLTRWNVFFFIGTNFQDEIIFLPSNSHWEWNPNSIGLYVVWPLSISQTHLPLSCLPLIQDMDHTLPRSLCTGCPRSLEGSSLRWLTPSLQLRSLLKCHLITEAFPAHLEIAQTPTIIC